MNLKLEYIPHESLGPFDLANPIEPYLELYPYILSKKGYEEGWDAYSFFDELVDAFVDDENKIAAISCKHNIYMNGVNLIGLHIDECFKTLELDKKDVPAEKLWVSDDEEQEVYELEALDLQLWVDKNELIVTAIVG